jgi:hypothetical protein
LPPRRLAVPRRVRQRLRVEDELLQMRRAQTRERGSRRRRPGTSPDDRQIDRTFRARTDAAPNRDFAVFSSQSPCDANEARRFPHYFAVFLSLTRSPRFPRFPLSCSRQYGGGGGYERSGGSWGGGGGGWNSGGGRGYNDRPRGPTPRPGDWNCPAGCGLVFASKPNCFRCGVAKPEGADLEYGQRQDDGYQPAGGGGDWNAPRNDYPPVAPQ